MNEQAPLALTIAVLVIGIFGLRLGLRMQNPRGASVVETWQRAWKLAAIVTGIGGIIVGAVNIVRWCLR